MNGNGDVGKAVTDGKAICDSPLCHQTARYGTPSATELIPSCWHRYKGAITSKTRMVQLPATAAIEYIAAWNENDNENENENWN